MLFAEPTKNQVLILKTLFHHFNMPSLQLPLLFQSLCGILSGWVDLGANASAQQPLSQANFATSLMALVLTRGLSFANLKKF